jgi:glyoxylase-like metal-dependent hydrolase (beta-lactamase superfamily II)
MTEHGASPLISTMEDGDVRVVKIGPMGPYGNNAYIVRDLARRESLLVDMPLETSALLDAIAADGNVRQVVATHWHPDHWFSYDAVREATGAPVLVGDREIKIEESRIDRRVADGEEVVVGAVHCTVVHTPGHTPGSICLRVGRALISGDTLFDGGPGKTSAAGDVETIIASITSRLYQLPDDTVVMPGHGSDTTIGESRAQYTEYVKHPHPPGYFGDVEWLGGGAADR